VTDELKARIDELVKSRRVVLFMKGSSMMPMCGFSQLALATLRAAGATDLKTVDVLKDPDLRSGLKEYSSWPTIPQVFIDGKLIGGSDLVKAMHERGELAALITGAP
jgi:monothiol glutaredoxin